MIKKLLILFLLLCLTSSSWAAFAYFHDGFETGGADAWSSVTGSPTFVAGAAHTGNYGMRCNASSEAIYVDTGLQSVENISFYLYIASLPSADCSILGYTSLSLGHSLALTTTGEGDLYVAGSKVIDGTTQLTTGQWYRISYGSAGGDAYLYINGSEEWHYSANVFLDGRVGINTASTADLYFDDVFFDTLIAADDVGDIRVLAARPTAEGTDQNTGSGVDWQDVGGNPATYDHIDSDPPNITDYDWAEADGGTLRYSVNLDNCGSGNLAGIGGSDTIEAVNFMWYYETDAGGVGDYASIIWDESTRAVEDTTIDDPRDPTWLQDYYALTPKDSDAWTQTHVNDLEMGMSTTDTNKDLWFHEACAMVAYKVSAAPPTLGSPGQAVIIGF